MEMQCPQCRKRTRDLACGLVVFVESECPICLTRKTPSVALPCGHTLCKDDFRKLGGILPASSAAAQPRAAVARNGGRASASARVPARVLNPDAPEFVPEVNAPFASHVARGAGAVQRRQPPAAPPAHVYVLCWTQSRSGSSAMRLWYADSNGDERNLYEFPDDSKMVRDGRGGVWVLCSTRGEESLWRLWHADRNGNERNLCEYPSSSKMTSDGVGGVFVLCSTASESGSQCQLWHVDWHGHEQALCQYPPNSQIVGDDHGKVWILCPTRQDDGTTETELWHADRSGNERCLFKYPPDSRMTPDGRGGVWVLCQTAGYDGWRLWHARSNGIERDLFQYHEGSVLVGDCAVHKP